MTKKIKTLPFRLLRLIVTASMSYSKDMEDPAGMVFLSRHFWYNIAE